MRYFTTLVALFFFPLNSQADYSETHLPELLVKADLIVHGIITHDLNSMIKIDILDHFKGAYTMNTIEVFKFMDWTCATRYTKYEPGQEAVFFIKHYDEPNYKEFRGYHIMGSGNEGELPIENCIVHLGVKYPKMHQDNVKSYLCEGGRITGLVFPFDSVSKALKVFSKLLNKSQCYDDRTSQKHAQNTFFQSILKESIRYPFREIEGAGNLLCVSSPFFHPTKTPEPPTEDIVYNIAEQMPLFPGCESIKRLKEREICAKSKLEAFIKSNLVYPPFAIQKRIEGKIVLQFIVEKEGSLSDIRILREIGGLCGTAGSKLVSKMPKWIPGKMNQKPVRVRIRLPIEFKLPEENYQN